MIDRYGIRWDPIGRYRDALDRVFGSIEDTSIASACRVAGIDEVVWYLNGEFNKLIQAFYGVEQ